MNCPYCDTGIFHPEDTKWLPDDLPDDIPDRGYSDIAYHSWCFEKVVEEERSEIAAKHGADG